MKHGKRDKIENIWEREDKEDRGDKKVGQNMQRK